MSIREDIRTILLRDLESLRKEVEAYPDSKTIWAVKDGITNSAGTLTLHLCGNLQHFIGAVLGKSGYVRDRDDEFTSRDLSADELLKEIAATSAAVEKTLDQLADNVLLADYPVQVGGRTLPTGRFLIHLCTHLAFHLGQIDYHRRLVTGNNESIGPQSISEL